MNSGKRYDPREDKAEQKRLKAVYTEVLSTEVWPGDIKMLKFCAGRIARIIELSDGSMLEIEKPRIETRFCFGYHDNRYNTESYDSAAERARNAQENEKYFKAENLKQFDYMIDQLQNRNVYTRIHYWTSPENSRLKSIELLRPWETAQAGWKPVAEQDLEKITEAYRLERAAFEKRLDNYLKRYGMSKVHTWTYWEDA